MSLEQVFKSKGKATYCMYLRAKKSSLQSDIVSMENKVAPLRSKVSQSNYTYTYTKEEKDLLDSYNLKITNMYQELKNYETKLSQNDCENEDKKVKNCKNIDERIKSKKDAISNVYTNVYKGNPKKVQQLNSELLKIENEFVESNCRDLLESERLSESGLILTEKSSIQESNVLKGNYKEQYVYIALGSVVLLTSLYIISKK